MFLGVLFIVAGILAIVFRGYIRLGSDIDPYYQWNNPTNPKRELNSPSVQIFIALVGVGFIVVGVLSMLGLY